MPRILRRVRDLSGFLSLLCLSVVAACGGSANQNPPRDPAEIAAAEERAFDHGVDFIGTMSGLEGQWRDAWERDLRTRCEGADNIVILTISSVRTDSDPEQRLTHRLVGKIESSLRGEKTPSEIEVWVRQGLLGFQSVNDNLSRLEGQRFIAYLRWYRTETGDDAAHWHMSPASDEIILETERILFAEPAP